MVRTDDDTWDITEGGHDHARHGRGPGRRDGQRSSPCRRSVRHHVARCGRRRFLERSLGRPHRQESLATLTRSCHAACARCSITWRFVLSSSTTFSLRPPPAASARRSSSAPDWMRAHGACAGPTDTPSTKSTGSGDSRFSLPRLSALRRSELQLQIVLNANSLQNAASPRRQR
jgi:hypothetical protein